MQAMAEEEAAVSYSKYYTSIRLKKATRSGSWPKDITIIRRRAWKPMCAN